MQKDEKSMKIIIKQDKKSNHYEIDVDIYQKYINKKIKNVHKIKLNNWENNFHNDANKITIEVRNVDRVRNFTKNIHRS